MQRAIDRAHEVAQTSLDRADWRVYHALQGVKSAAEHDLAMQVYHRRHGVLGQVSDLPSWGSVTAPGGGHSTLP